LTIKRLGFSMIELVFVIVILGILAMVAVPKMAATRGDAQIAKGRSDIASIRSAIVSERQKRLLKGQSNFINKLHSSNISYFDNNGTAENALLMYGITPKVSDGHWHGASQTSSVANKNVWIYKFRVLGEDNTFTYTQETGTFSCTVGNTAPSCAQLTQ